MIPTDKNKAGKEKPLFLVAPLDWGLGHTTRVIPLIKHLDELGCNVVVACNSTQKALLEKEIPQTQFVHLEGYNIQYGLTRTGTLARMLRNLPNILTKVKSEEMWFLRFLTQNQVDAVISDNRYGMHHADIPSILLTHQLHIRSGFGYFADRFIRILLYRHIRAFTECWIPDVEGTKNFAGALSHPKKLPGIPVRYIGCLSRLQTCTRRQQSLFPVLIILSGPEPQRTILENKILEELRAGNFQDIVLLRGLPGHQTQLPALPGITILEHADSKKLTELMCGSGLIISRAGYTTVMDVIKLQKKTVMVATPGQAEQEYLSRHLSASNIVLRMEQKDFSVARAISSAATFDYHFPDIDMEQYKPVLSAFIASRFSS